MRAWRSAALFALGSLGLAAASPGAATQPHPEPSTSAELAQPVAELFVVGSAEQYAKIQSAVGLGALGFDARWERVAAVDRRRLLEASGSARVRCFIDVSNPRRARLYFSDGAASRFLLRELGLSEQLDELDLEALSQIVELSTRALLEEDQAVLTRVEAGSLLPTLAAAEDAVEEDAGRAYRAPPLARGEDPASSRMRVGAGAYYNVSAHSPEILLVHGPGLLLELTSHTPQALLRLELAARYELPQSYDEPRIGLDFSTLALRLGAEVALATSSRSFTGARLAGGMDLVRIAPHAAPGEPSFAPAPSRVVKDFTVGLSLTQTWRLSPELNVFAALGADFYPARVEYALGLESGAASIVTPYRIRPGAAFGVRIW